MIDSGEVSFTLEVTDEISGLDVQETTNTVITYHCSCLRSHNVFLLCLPLFLSVNEQNMVSTLAQLFISLHMYVYVSVCD